MDNNIITCVIIEDEPLARELIENFVHQTPILQLLTSFENGADALLYLQNNQVDLVISDIEMPLINGMELAKSLKNPPYFIFVTAYERYAIDGFEIGAVDYIKKPVTYARFIAAISKINIKNQHTSDLKLNNTLPQFLTIKSESIFHRIAFSEIKYIETMGDFIKIHLADNSIVISNSTMKNMEEKLPSDLFFRIHTSYIISLNNVRKIFGNTVVLNTGEELAIAKLRKQELFIKLNIKED
ncbi:LytR/AlgR family response regulator transcription factor [Rhizosphaericola mali]|uniref:Response regulator transcription factor n=1 Tax=Rhizosphaericola mali TaxID=2545455 RepID=A0A5P2G433_9BACT|nr:LytTR family DNA-binding domain-containing protein [Rhizosphaericola mali]QES90596.1 response regulator transcription factor [Rhizosphaericola mali]